MGVSENGKAQKIEWMSIEEVEEAIAKEPRKVLIDVYTDWCGWCKRMDATTFREKELVNYLNENYYCVKLDGEDKSVLNYRGHEFRFVNTGRRGYNELTYELLRGKMSYPSLVILDKSLEVLQRFKGYRSSKELLPIITYLGDDVYKNTSWDDYLKAEKSKK